MFRKKKRGDPAHKKVGSLIINTFTSKEEKTETIDRGRRIVLKKNKFYMAIFIIAVSIYGVALALYILKPQEILSRFTKPPEKVVNPAVNQGSLEKLQKELHEKNIPFEEIYIASDDATIITKVDGMKIYFDKYKDVVFQVGSLQQILQRLTIDSSAFLQKGKKPSSIDLRFSKPIIRY